MLLIFIIILIWLFIISYQLSNLRIDNIRLLNEIKQLKDNRLKVVNDSVEESNKEVKDEGTETKEEDVWNSLK